MVKIAFVFPGQGSQFIGMGRDFYDHVPAAKQLFEEANEVLQYDLTSICFNGPEETLKLTENTQPALLIHSTMALKMLRENGINPILAAGHSLGEFSALVASGALKFSDAVRLVHLRGKFMQEAVPVGKGSMAAIIGLPLDTIQELCDKVSSDSKIVQPANLNSPIQTVIAGHKECVEKVSKDALAAGAKKTVMLPVSAPFHCPLMSPAAAVMSDALADVAIESPLVPLVSNVSARPTAEPEIIRRQLVEQVTGLVRWRETVSWLAEDGVTMFAEIGSGRVLSGLARRVAVGSETQSVGKPSEIDDLLERLA